MALNIVKIDGFAEYLLINNISVIVFDSRIINDWSEEIDYTKVELINEMISKLEGDARVKIVIVSDNIEMEQPDKKYSDLFEYNVSDEQVFFINYNKSTRNMQEISEYHLSHIEYKYDEHDFLAVFLSSETGV